MDNDNTQKEVSKMVNTEVFQNQTMLIDALLGDEKDLFTFEDIENYYFTACPECGGEVKGDKLNGTEFTCEDCETVYTEDEYANLEDEAKEVFEWWLVSDWLARKLKERGEPMLENDYGTWWGRTCTGQAIYLDGVIEKIWVEANIPL